MIYLLLSFFILLPVLYLCYQDAVLSSYETKHRIGYAEFRNPAENHDGAVIMKISMMMSIGGKGADWELSKFPKKGAAVNIGRTTSGEYMIVSTGICNVKISGRPLRAGELKKLQNFNLIEISLEDSPRGPWRFEYQKGR